MRRWGVLAFYAGLFQVAGICVAVMGLGAGILIGLGGLAAGGGLGLGAGAFGALVGVSAILTGLGLGASGQLIEVFMSIERNTRRVDAENVRDLDW